MSAGKFQWHSKPFRLGLIEGFGSPLFFFIPRNYPIEPVSLNDAWDDVSRALQDSMKAEREKGGEGKQKSSGKKRLETCHAN